MDIRSGCGYPASALSNFAPHRFIIDEVECFSMEGFLQSLKFEKIHIQEEICKLSGRYAKQRGKSRNTAWQRVQLLWWKGKPMRRDGAPYQKLLDRAYEEMFIQSESFRKALMATGDSVLKHSIGRNNEAETVLTEREFCSRLMKLREKYKKQKI